jgi:hypothetical protein
MSSEGSRMYFEAIDITQYSGEPSAKAPSVIRQLSNITKVVGS